MTEAELVDVISKPTALGVLVVYVHTVVVPLLRRIASGIVGMRAEGRALALMKVKHLGTATQAKAMHEDVSRLPPLDGAPAMETL